MPPLSTGWDRPSELRSASYRLETYVVVCFAQDASGRRTIGCLDHPELAVPVEERVVEVRDARVALDRQNVNGVSQPGEQPAQPGARRTVRIGAGDPDESLATGFVVQVLEGALGDQQAGIRGHWTVLVGLPNGQPSRGHGRLPGAAGHWENSQSRCADDPISPSGSVAHAGPS
jgi:hypothetical protein